MIFVGSAPISLKRNDLPFGKSEVDLMILTKAPILLFPDVVAIEAYMSGEPARSTGFWLKLSKISAPKATISKGEAIEAALCCGWIDGQLAKFDEHHFLIRMTPRRAGSRWSAKNRETAERLAREGRLKANGLEQIE
ncbi:YdeI/OmpD-associated family protein [Methylocystis sp.]|uniref:YdeI/OmpD-associated family protein n=1 Tax=Methylocystis sp. TaxID=1911079 RepID=UPI003DA6AA3F